MSVRTLGYDVRVRSRTTSASTSIHGPWQITPTGAGGDELPHERHGLVVLAQLIGIRGSTGKHQAVEVAGGDLRDEVIDGVFPCGVDVLLHCLDLALLDRDESDRGALVLESFTRLDELDLLDSVRRENCDGQSGQSCPIGGIHVRVSFLGCCQNYPARMV